MIQRLTSFTSAASMAPSDCYCSLAATEGLTLDFWALTDFWGTKACLLEECDT